MRAFRLSPRAPRAGFTLIELMISLVIAGAILTAAYRILAGNQRFYRAQTQITEVQQNIRAVIQLLPGDLRELSSAEGDIYAMASDSIALRSMRGFGIICDTPSVALGRFTLRNSQLFAPITPSATRTRVIVFRDNDTEIAADDSWIRGPVVTVASGTCTDGSAGTQFTVLMNGGNGLLAGVTIGSPVRLYERAIYKFYDTGSGWFLGIRNYVGGVYQTISPVAGPLRSNDGLAFVYYDSTGAVTNDVDEVASIELKVRGVSSQPIMVQGRATGYYSDSLSVRVALRNN
jgi:prepilin-type N-terminal cleavage/methylation domain-containing protein